MFEDINMKFVMLLCLILTSCGAITGPDEDVKKTNVESEVVNESEYSYYPVPSGITPCIESAIYRYDTLDTEQTMVSMFADTIWLAEEWGADIGAYEDIVISNQLKYGYSDYTYKIYINGENNFALVMDDPDGNVFVVYDYEYKDKKMVTTCYTNGKKLDGINRWMSN